MCAVWVCLYVCVSCQQMTVALTWYTHTYRTSPHRSHNRVPHIAHHTSHIAHHTSHLTYNTTHRTSHVIHHTSHITQHTSHHTSRIIHHTSRIITHHIPHISHITHRTHTETKSAKLMIVHCNNISLMCLVQRIAVPIRKHRETLLWAWLGGCVGDAWSDVLLLLLVLLFFLFLTYCFNVFTVNHHLFIYHWLLWYDEEHTYTHTSTHTHSHIYTHTQIRYHDLYITSKRSSQWEFND